MPLRVRLLITDMSCSPVWGCLFVAFCEQQPHPKNDCNIWYNEIILGFLHLNRFSFGRYFFQFIYWAPIFNQFSIVILSFINGNSGCVCIILIYIIIIIIIIIIILKPLHYTPSNTLSIWVPWSVKQCLWTVFEDPIWTFIQPSRHCSQLVFTDNYMTIKILF